MCFPENDKFIENSIKKRKTTEEKFLHKSLFPPQEFWEELELKPGINELKIVFKGNLDKEY